MIFDCRLYEGDALAVLKCCRPCRLPISNWRHDVQLRLVVVSIKERFVDAGPCGSDVWSHARSRVCHDFSGQVFDDPVLEYRVECRRVPTDVAIGIHFPEMCLELDMISVIG